MGRIPKDLRYIVLERDDFRCKFCGVGGKDSDIILEVHHVIWRNLGGLDEPENLITVCPHCHAQFFRDEVINCCRGGSVSVPIPEVPAHVRSVICSPAVLNIA
jgi:predicted restriction endonuclease